MRTFVMSFLVGLSVVYSDMEGYVSYMANLILGWSQEQVMAYCAHLRNEVRNIKHHIYVKQRIVIGRKPINA